MPADNSCITLPGPWEHRLIQANGAQFHFAEAGSFRADSPVILLVHGFPEYWWAWRNQIKSLAEAGYYVAAVDLRGFGGSDKTPHCADASILTDDLACIIRSLGAKKAVLAGHGRGGALCWSAVSAYPQLCAGLITVSTPHPRTLHRIGTHLTLRTWRQTLKALFTDFSQRSLRDPQKMRKMLEQWSAPGNLGAAAHYDIYTQAMRLPGGAKPPLDQLHWILFSQHTAGGRRYLKESANPVRLPVLAIRGVLDPLLPARAWHRDLEFARGTYRFAEIPHAGHFAHEEQPKAVTREIIDFLGRL